MPQAIVDPAELRRFAHNLKQFNNELHNRMLVLHGQLPATVPSLVHRAL